jgi:hypothetical protein
VVESRELSVRARVERTANARCARMVENGEERESLHMFDTDFLICINFNNEEIQK